jgi:Domain of unknown function (DUF4335)
MRVSGDRSKLEALHQTVEEYVKDLLIRAPLPQLNGGEDAEKLPRQSRSELGSNSLSSDLDSQQKRPIDALNVVDDRPRIEADGLSRHLFYLGSGADANTSVMSLSTLQLFDLSSALSEGLTPVAVPEIEAVPETVVGGAVAGTMAAAAMAAETTDTEKIVEPVVLPQETVNNKSNKSSLNSVATPLKSEKPDLEEPRVVLPSASDSDSIDSGDLYGLETESSILERSTPSRDRFKMPKPSLGSLNLPELPDFSRSPLTSIPLWLGLGGMASLIIGFPFISGYFKTGGAVSKKPATPTTQVASVPANEPPAYQPTNPSLPIGVGTPSINGLPSPSSTLGSGAGGLTTQFGSGAPVSPVTGGLGTTPGAANPSSNDVINRQRAINAEKQRQAAAKAAAAPNGNGTPNSKLNNGKIAQGGPTEARPSRRSGGDAGGASQQSRNSVNPDLQAPILPNDEGRLQVQRGGDSTGESSRSRGRRQPKPAVKKPPVAERNAPPAEPDVVVGQGNEFDSNGSGQLRPVEPPSRSSTLDLETPNSPSESVQTRGLQNHFQGRWKGDPNFGESLEYQVNVGKNGRVISVEGRTEKSRIYLSKTGFLKPGDLVSKTGQQDQKVWLILNPTGEVQTLADSE